jgi:hypothetical protein
VAGEYRIVSDLELKGGASPEEVRDALARSFRADPGRIEKMLKSKGPVLLKSGLDAIQARRLVKRFESAGLLCRAEAVKHGPQRVAATVSGPSLDSPGGSGRRFVLWVGATASVLAMLVAAVFYLVPSLYGGSGTGGAAGHGNADPVARTVSADVAHASQGEGATFRFSKVMLMFSSPPVGEGWSEGHIYLKVEEALLSLKEKWEVKRDSERKYLLRDPRLDFVLEVDLDSDKAYFVSSGGERYAIDVRHFKLGARGGQRMQIEGGAYMVLEERSRDAAVYIEGFPEPLTSSEDWAITQTGPKASSTFKHYEVKHLDSVKYSGYMIVNVRPPYEIVYMKPSHAATAGGGSSSHASGSRPLSKEETYIQKISSGTGYADDRLEFLPVRYGGNSLEYQWASKWDEKKKETFSGILLNEEYDVLVLPFQVSQAALDYQGRSLMARYLGKHLREAHGLKVPDITFVSRVLGERNRRFDLNEVRELAGKLKVRHIVMGFAGHDVAGKAGIQVTWLTSNNNWQTMFDSVKNFKYMDLPLLDRKPPSELFLDMLEDGDIDIPLSKSGKSSGFKKKRFKRAKRMEVPSSPNSMASKRNSPIVSAYYLQLLGMLHPIEGYDRDQLFERSLELLTMVDPRSEDYPLLKARGLFYLYRRPAALEALKSPLTAEEKAFSSFMNGNLGEASGHLKAIKSPLHRLLTEIELTVLRNSYIAKPFSDAYVDSVVRQYPGWEVAVKAAMHKGDIWYVGNSLEAKAFLDSSYPASGRTAADFVRASAISGIKQEAIMSAYNHVEELRSRHPEYYLGSAGASPKDGDIIDLAGALASAVVFDTLKVEIFARGNYGGALDMIKDYELYYDGELVFTAYNYEAVKRMSKKASGSTGRLLKEQKKQLLERLVTMRQGQTWVPGRTYSETYRLHFPPKPHWQYLLSYNTMPDDQVLRGAVTKLKEMKKSDWIRLNYYLGNIRYKNYSYSDVEGAFEYLEDYGLDKEALYLLTSVEGRYKDSPKRFIFMAGMKEKQKAGSEELLALYEEFRKASPEDWRAYEGAAEVFVNRGDFVRAKELLASYPPFSVKEPVNPVALSNYSLDAGEMLAWRGALEESASFFRMSLEDYPVNSAANYHAGYWLGFMNNDYNAVSYFNYLLASRYADKVAIGYLSNILHMVGNHEDAWNVLASANGYSRGLFWAARNGYRMEGKGVSALFEHFAGHELEGWSYGLAANIFTMQIMDRKPNDGAGKLIQKCGSYVDKGDKESLGNVDAIYSLYLGYKALREGKHKKAMEHLERSGKLTNWYKIDESALLYYAVSSIEAGSPNILDRWTETYAKRRKSSRFYLHLIDAYRAGVGGDHGQALKKLRHAQYSMPDIGEGFVNPWYQLVETAEWLYERTGRDEYRRFAVEKARYVQRIRPMFTWSFTVEAKYTDSETDRLRALAIGQYLDPGSERLSGFSRAQKEKASQWFENNNPFVFKEEVQKQKKI